MFTIDQLREIVDDCKFNMDGVPWTPVVSVEAGNRPILQIVCDGHCNVTGERLFWKSRKHFLSFHMCKSEVIRTVYKAIMTAVEHEVNEKFTYRGKMVFNPHMDIDALAEVCDRNDVRS